MELGGGFIENISTGEITRLKVKDGVYVMDVVVMPPESEREQSFQRQVS